MNNYRILLISRTFPPDQFSESIVTGKLALAFHNQGWHIDIICGEYNGPSYSEAMDSIWLPLEKHVYRVRYKHGNNFQRSIDLLVSISKMGFPIEGVRWARRGVKLVKELIKSQNYNVIISRSPQDCAHLLALKIHKLSGIPWIANFNDPAALNWPAPYAQKVSKVKRIFYRLFFNRVLSESDFLTFPAQRLLNYFNKTLRADLAKCKVIPHVLISDLIVKSDMDRHREEKNQNRHFLKMCHAGNLSSERNPEILFTALHWLIQKKGLKNIELDIIGTKDAFTESIVENLRLTDHIKYLGTSPFNEIIQKMADYDILIILEAKLEEGIFFPSKLSDYLLAEKLVWCISPKNSCLKDMLEEYNFGVWSDNEDIESVKQSLESLYHQWEINQLLKDRDLEKIRQYLSDSHVIDIYKQIFEELEGIYRNPLPSNRRN